MMTKLEELINGLCPDGVEYKPLEECCIILDKQRKPVTKAARQKGEYRYYGANGIQDYVSDYIFDGTFVLVGEDGSVMTSNGKPIVNWAEGKIWVNNHAHIIAEKEGTSLRYLYHLLQTIDVRNLIHGNIPKLTQGDFKSLQIPLPPLYIQSEIVHILDSFTLLTAELTAELTARQKQYAFYRDYLLDFSNEDVTKKIPDIDCSNVEYKKLGDISNIIRGGNFQKKDFIEQGKPCIHYGQIYTRLGTTTSKSITYLNDDVYSKSKKAMPNDIIMAVTSENIEDVCKCTVWVGNKDVAVSGHTAIIHPSINSKYLGYYFQTKMFFKQKKKLAHGTKVIEVTPDKLNDILIPVPPLSVQKNIVKILDRFDKLNNDMSEGLPAEIETRKKQYEYYRDILLSFDDKACSQIVKVERERELTRIKAIKWLKLCDIADIGTGSSNTNEALEVGKYPFFVRSQDVKRKDTYEFDETAIITSGDGVGVGKIFHFVEGKYALHQRAYRIHITDENVLPKYFFYYMKATFLNYIEKNSFHSSVTSVRRPMLNNYLVPVPPLEEQERIVSILDRFDKLCNDISEGLPAEIEARQNQYEYYRDKLLSFKEKNHA